MIKPIAARLIRGMVRLAAPPEWQEKDLVILGCRPAGDGLIVPPTERALRLDGTQNSRQLGGLPTDGGTVRPGIFYRSDQLTELSAADCERLAQLPIRTTMDVRTPPEIDYFGKDRYQAPRVLSLPMYADHEPRCGQDYHDILYLNPAAVQGFFGGLADPQAYPVLLHCKAGKDRTGMLTALLLESLGTPRDIIMDDYMQSKRNMPNERLEPEWLQRIFADVDAAGGIAPMLRGFGVTHAQLEAVRRNLSS